MNDLTIVSVLESTIDYLLWPENNVEHYDLLGATDGPRYMDQMYILEDQPEVDIYLGGQMCE